MVVLKGPSVLLELFQVAHIFGVMILNSKALPKLAGLLLEYSIIFFPRDVMMLFEAVLVS